MPKDTVTFTIIVTPDEYEKLCEMMRLEKVESINDVYKIALNKRYHALKTIREIDGLTINVQENCNKLQN